MPPKGYKRKRNEGDQGDQSHVSPVSAANEKLLKVRIEKLEKQVRSVEEQLVTVQAALAAKDAALATKKTTATSKVATGSQPNARKSPAGQRYVQQVSYPPLPPPRRFPSVHIDICICAVERRVYRRDQVGLFG